ALRFLRIESLLQLIHHAPCATLALVHGACFGAGADIVAACALRLAAPDSRFRLPGLRFGVALGTRRLAELVGRDTALSLLMTAREFSSEDALAAGLLTEISAKADWPERVAAAAAAAAVLPSDSLTSLLRLTRADHRDADLAALARSVAVPGLKNRIAAYLASRSPS
ncbi:MAG: enoyl-CoA hydratase/isomerase family protein, partial [Hyphomicrobiaceae bacterium]|nr:enoyl-CoA hydratase/isomerase family protein [Hyphomicrobiaceae bacterium]